MNGGKLQFNQVSLEDVPRVVELFKSSVQDNVESVLDLISIEGLYERFLVVLKDISCDPIQDVSEIQEKLVERAYVYCAELYRRTRVKSGFLSSYESFVRRFKCACGKSALYQEDEPVCGECVSKEYSILDRQSTTLLLYNRMLHELSLEGRQIREEYHEQTQTQEIVREILRRPVLLAEINETVRKILNKTGQNQMRFKHYLTSYQCRLLHKNLEDEPMENQEELLVGLKKMLQSFV
jgi:hypothetical protein